MPPIISVVTRTDLGVEVGGSSLLLTLITWVDIGSIKFWHFKAKMKKKYAFLRVKVGLFERMSTHA